MLSFSKYLLGSFISKRCDLFDKKRKICESIRILNYKKNRSFYPFNFVICKKGKNDNDETEIVYLNYRVLFIN